MKWFTWNLQGEVKASLFREVLQELGIPSILEHHDQWGTIPECWLVLFKIEKESANVIWDLFVKDFNRRFPECNSRKTLLTAAAQSLL